MQAVAFDHSATRPAEPVSPLAGPLRGKKFPSVLIEPRGYQTHCHIWQGSHNSRGYPLRGVNRRVELLHRLVCQHHHGLPDGWDAHHICGVKSCVNPAHLAPRSKQAHSDERYPFPARAFVLCLLATHGALPARWIRRIGAEAFGFQPNAVSRALARLDLERDEDGCYLPPVTYVIEAEVAWMVPYHRRYKVVDERGGGSESRLTKPFPRPQRGMEWRNRVQGFFYGRARNGHTVFGVREPGAEMGAAS